MDKQKRKKIFLVLTLIVALIVFYYCRQGITIRIENNSNTNIHDLWIGFTGGNIEVPDLIPHESQSFKINPTQDSGLVIRWKQDDGKQFEVSDLTYIWGPDMGLFGKLEFTLIFQNNSAYLLEHDNETWVTDLLENRTETRTESQEHPPTK